MKKIKSIVFIMLVIMLSNIVLPCISLAASEKVTIYGKTRYGKLLKRNGVDLVCIPLAYTKDGVEHPVYCLNLERDGATENFSYEVNIDNELTNMEIWRTIVNGYPYKTPEELGCKTKEEAYLATRHAVYCAVYGRDLDSYKAGDAEGGERTLNALKQIVNKARNGNEVKPSSTLKISADKASWQTDLIDNKYVSKTFTVTASAGIKNYSISLSGDIVEGIKITDTNNNEKDYFESNETFKILIPIQNLNKNGNFTIEAKGKVATKPVFIGLPDNASLQNVAVTGSVYENGTGTKTEYYFENSSKIIIIKQDQETKSILPGVKFELLNEEQEIIYANLITDEQGKIVIENLLPGKYYIREVETLEGYEMYEKVIEIDLRLNEETTVKVNNLQKDEISENETPKTELEVEQIKNNEEIKQDKTEEVKPPEKTSHTEIKTEKEVMKLPKTGM